MAAVAEQNSQHVVLTSDNPRNEQPAEILSQMARGLSSSTAAWQIEDRQQAIERAVLAAQRQDVILLAGKGHEETQEIAGQKYPFSDVSHAQAALLRRAQLQEQQA
jgi:UDP-N-acetylmuramoyl-L-alanyl-D-glutamate--2,6-diaminopimelate ligase